MTKVPGWYWLASGALLLWSLIGLMFFAIHVSLGEATLAQMPAEDAAYFRALPSWFSAAFALATIPAVLGAVALLLRLRVARALFLASLVGVVIQFGWVLGMTDRLAVKGLGAAVVPALIFGIGLAQLWFAGLAARRRWVR